MLYSKSFLPVNWVDGMKLSGQHFVQTDHHIQDLVRDAVSLQLTNYNFGLLPPVKGSTLSHDFDLLEKMGNYVEVRLSRCNAITQGGCRIAINPDVLRFTVLTASFEVDPTLDDEQRPMYDVVLLVNPFQRVPVGDPDPEESPLRHPHTDYYYQLMVVPSHQINANDLGQHHMVIGKVVFQEGRYVVDSQYIPPCASVASHPQLISYYKHFGWGLNEIQVSSFKILRKIHDQNHPSELARNAQILCNRLLDYLGTVFFQYRNLDHQHPPVLLVRYFADLTSIFYTALNMLPNRQKEELLHYFYEWVDITPGQFEELLLNLLEHDYNHQQIGQSMQLIERFLDVFTRLWAKLSTLEYIGQRKDTILVREEAPAALASRRGWNILDA
ncbi:MAG: hypothetical protein EAZ91_21020 [Cytophagales bacterium]|nr:MAG: hypothetical protein EAZ91_21020 [Cytophagales bacterium]